MRESEQVPDERSGELALLVHQQVGPPVLGQTQQVGHHQRGSVATEEAVEDLAAALLAGQVTERGENLAPRGGMRRLARARLRRRDAGPGHQRQRVVTRRPQHLVPGRQQRVRERNHRQHMAVTRRGGDQHPHRRIPSSPGLSTFP